MKRFLKKIIPEPVKKVRKRILEKYYLTNGLKNKKKNNKKIINGVIKVVFVVYMPQEWNSLDAVYMEMQKDKRFKTYVIVTPHESRLSDGSIISSYEFFSRLPGEVKEAKTNKGWFDVKKLKPDIIFRQESFDDNFPDEYSTHKLARIARLFYIPYAYTNTIKHLPMEFHLGFVGYCSVIFPANDQTYIYLKTMKEKYKELGDLDIYNLGFPRYDLLDEVVDETSQYKRFLWIPRYSLDSVGNDATSFFRYRNELIQIFKANPDRELLIRPHPLMFDEFIKKGAMSEEEVDSFISEIKAIPNVSLDNEMDYMRSFKWSDSMIADHSSLNFEYFAMGKPIIYCSNDVNTSLGDMSIGVYDGTDWNYLKRNLEDLWDGKDNLKKTRTKLAHIYNKKMNRHCAKIIVDTCYKVLKY